MNESTEGEQTLNNDEPEHRQALIHALRREGLEAYEFHSGGGTMHVVVDLVNEPGGDLLQIATGSAASPCDVGLMGWRNQANVQDETWIAALTQKQAVTAFRQYWEERSDWVHCFERGDLDI